MSLRKIILSTAISISAALGLFSDNVYASTEETVVCNGCSSYQREQSIVNAVDSSMTDYQNFRVVDFHSNSVSSYVVLRNYEPGLPSLQIVGGQNVTPTTTEMELFNDFQSLKSELASSDLALAAEYGGGTAVIPVNVPATVIESAYDVVNTPAAQHDLYDYFYTYEFDNSVIYKTSNFLNKLLNTITKSLGLDDAAELFQLRIIFKFDDGSIAQFVTNSLILREDDYLAMSYLSNSSVDSDGNLIPDSEDDVSDTIYSFTGGAGSYNYMRMQSLLIFLIGSQTTMECNAEGSRCIVTPE